MTHTKASIAMDVVVISMVIAAAVALFMSTATAISYGISSDGGSTSTVTDAGIEDQVSSNTVLSQDTLQNSISGGGNLKENHTMKNLAGYEASVGVDLVNASHYAYSYQLNPGDRDISASETLDVDKAQSIYAYANAKSPFGPSAGSEISIKNGILSGYSNGAAVVNDTLSTHQGFTRASGDIIEVASWGLNKNTNTKAYASVRGGMAGYLDSSLTGSSSAFTGQTGHVTGEFASSITSESYIKNNMVFRDRLTRKSDYGTDYDLNSGVISCITRPKNIYNHLTYYVDAAHPEFSKIQGAIDVSHNGDGIKISEGRYYENLDIKKSLFISGAGAGKTVIDGSKEGRVITVDKDASVYISGLSLQNGRDQEGGAIKNEGNLILNDYEISHNNAIYGGGIFNTGNLALGSGSIDHNSASQDGGAVYNRGKLSILGANVTSNNAKYGGGLYNTENGQVQLIEANVSNNHAWENGGGVWNKGTFQMDASDITDNQAKNGGGVWNDGLFLMGSGHINSNRAYDGGGVFNGGDFTILNGSMTNNEALNRGGAIYNDGGTLMLSGGDISSNRASNDGGIHSTYKFKKKGINGNRSIVHDNQNGDIGWHRKKGALISVICGVIAAVILIAVLTVLTVGIAMYITAAAMTSVSVSSAIISTVTTSTTAILTGVALPASVASAVTAAGTTALVAAAASASIATAIEVIAVAACVGLALLAADAMAWGLSMYFAK